MDLDEQAIRAGRDRGAAHRQYLVAQPGAVARIRHHRQVGQLLHQRDRREVEQVARRRVEAADAALAENDLAVPLGEDVLRAHQQVGDRGRHATLEQHGFADAPDGAEQGIVLHVARADLDAVGHVRHQVRALVVQRLGDDGEARLATREREHGEPLLAEALKGIGGAARLVCAAAQRRATRVTHLLRGQDDLRLALHRAGAGDDRDLAAAEHDARRDGDQRVLLPPLARYLLVRLGDVDHLGHAFQRLQSRAVHAAVVADESHRGTLRAGHGARLIPHLLDHLDDARHVLRRRVVSHHHQHQPSSISTMFAGSACKPGLTE